MLTTCVKFDSSGRSIVPNFGGAHLLSFDHTPQGWGEIEPNDRDEPADWGKSMPDRYTDDEPGEPVAGDPYHVGRRVRTKNRPGDLWIPEQTGTIVERRSHYADKSRLVLSVAYDDGGGRRAEPDQVELLDEPDRIVEVDEDHENGFVVRDAGEPGDVCEGEVRYGLGLSDDFVSERDLFCDPPADLLHDGIIDELISINLASYDYHSEMADHRKFYRQGLMAGLDSDCPPEEPTGLSDDDLESWRDGASVAAVFCHARAETERDVMVAAGRRFAGV